MSFELVLTTGNKIDASTQSVILSCFESNVFFQVVERTIAKERLSCTYSYLETDRKDRPEDFCVIIEQAEVYLCFYSATTEQQNRVTLLLEECVHRVGIQEDFEEL